MEIPRHWRLNKQRYLLVGEVCPHCDLKIFPPRDICPRCGEKTSTNSFEIRVEKISKETNGVICESRVGVGPT